MIYEMAVGRPPWAYQCPHGSTVDEYFDGITHKAKVLFQGADQSTEKLEQGLSTELRSLIRYERLHPFFYSSCNVLIRLIATH